MVLIIRSIRNLFEPRLFRSILNFKPMAEYFKVLNLALGVIEDMNLNRRIWGKAGPPGIAPAKARDPGNAAACFNRGVTYKRTGQFGQAYADFKAAAEHGHPKAGKVLKTPAFEELCKQAAAAARKEAQMVRKVTQKGDILAMTTDQTTGSYWAYKGSVWFVGEAPETLEQVGPVEAFRKKAISGEINAELLEDFLD
ncbi:MAG: DUF3137 domain-containing protein [Desulfobacterales bacterium]|nr:DUF3137 domain-containing protein [Desulfobacterales bacterium]